MEQGTSYIVALGPVNRELVEPQLLPGQQFITDPTPEQLALADAAIVRAAYRVDAATLQAMPRLKVLARTGVGTDLVDLQATGERGIPVVITPGSNTNAVAEGVFTHLLALVKKLPQLHGVVAEGRWDERASVPVGDLENHTLGVVGYGRIGQRVAALAGAFGMKVLAYDPFASIPERQAVADVDELLAASDFVTLHLPLLEETRNLINARRLDLMKPSAVVINCSRGGLIDLDAALRALESGQLGGMGLDVFDVEPPEHHPVFDHPLVTLTPHLMGFTTGSMAATVRDAVSGAQDVLAGRTPPASL